MTTIYLAGPMAGCSDSQATDWRDTVTTNLQDAYPGEFTILNPMLRDYREVDCSPEEIFRIVHDDKADIRKADVILANCWKISVGTSMEIHYAHSLSKHIITIIPSDTIPSPWTLYHSTHLVYSIKDGLVLTKYNHIQDKIPAVTP